MQKPGKLIVFEGVDRCGKSTAALETLVALRKAGRPSHYIHYPGHTLAPLIESAFELCDHFDPYVHRTDHVDEVAMQMAYIAKHIDMLTDSVIPNLMLGNYVIMDRSWWSAWVQLRKYISPEWASIMLTPETYYWLHRLNTRPIVYYIERPTQAPPELLYYHELLRLAPDLDEVVYTLTNDGTEAEFKERLRQEWAGLLA